MCYTVNSKRLLYISKSTPTILPKTRETFTQSNERTPSLLQTNNKKSFLKAIEKVIKEVNIEEKTISDIIRKK